LLPLQIGNLSDVLNRETEYDKSFKEHKEKTPHILICGEVNSGALDFFLRQFLHPNNTNWKDKVVILCPSLPSHNLKRVLLNSAYEQRVVYLQGSAMLDTDLKRASASTARLCFVMSNKLSTETDQSDTATNFITISLRHFNARVPIFVQVLKTDNIRHLHLSGADNILCVDQLKMGLLAKSSVMPGAMALFTAMLFTSRRYTAEKVWCDEYLAGCCNELHQATIPAFLHGLLSFNFIAHFLYHEFQILTIALSDGDKITLLPTKRLVYTDMILILFSATPDCSRKVSEISLPQVQKYKTMLHNYDKIVQAWNRTSFSTRLISVARESRVSMHSVQRTFRNSIERAGSFVYAMPGAKPKPAKTFSLTRSSSIAQSKIIPSAEDLSVEDLSAGTGNLFALPPAIPMPTPPRTANGSRSYAVFIGTPVPKNISGHIVLCGVPNQLRDFIAPLRRGQSIPIVIISPMVLTRNQYIGIRTFDCLYYVRGSPLAIQTLKTAAVTKAKTIVILQPLYEDTNDLRAQEEFIDTNMIDTNVITVHRFITDACYSLKIPDCPLPTIVTELTKSNMLRFLNDKIAIDDSSFKVAEIVSRQIMLRADDPVARICHPLLASGKVFISNFLDSLLASCCRYGSLLDIFQLLIHGDNKSTGLEQIQVPQKFHGQTFASCFDALLLQQHVLCIGLYRKNSLIIYAVLNPSPALVLGSDDMLFILHLMRRRLKQARATYAIIRNKLIKPRKRGESFRKWVGRNLDNSILAALLDIFQAVLGTLVTVLYCYRNWSSWNISTDELPIRYAHAFFGLVFLFDYTLRQQ
ncbi:calcium-activated potassium channel subunit alpha-1, partial [Thraustotheca clavata]